MDIKLVDGINSIETVEVNNASVQIVIYPNHTYLTVWHDGYADGTLTVNKKEAQELINALSKFVGA